MAAYIQGQSDYKVGAFTLKKIVNFENPLDSLLYRLIENDKTEDVIENGVVIGEIITRAIGWVIKAKGDLLKDLTFHQLIVVNERGGAISGSELIPIGNSIVDTSHVFPNDTILGVDLIDKEYLVEPDDVMGNYSSSVNEYAGSLKQNKFSQFEKSTRAYFLGLSQAKMLISQLEWRKALYPNDDLKIIFSGARMQTGRVLGLSNMIELNRLERASIIEKEARRQAISVLNEELSAFSSDSASVASGVSVRRRNDIVGEIKQHKKVDRTHSNDKSTWFTLKVEVRTDTVRFDNDDTSTATSWDVSDVLANTAKVPILHMLDPCPPGYRIFAEVAENSRPYGVTGKKEADKSRIKRETATNNVDKVLEAYELIIGPDTSTNE